MKSVLISMRHKWCSKIANGEKVIEVRKSAPKEVPFKAYIYCTKGNGECEWYDKVVGEFICDKVYSIKNQGCRFVVANEEQGVTNEIALKSCLDYDDMVNYLGDEDGYGWHIADLKVYDKPKELSEFTSPRVCINYIDLPAYGHIGCNMCKYSYTINCMIKCRINGREPLTRPPQSWQYVEELGNE